MLSHTARASDHENVPSSLSKYFIHVGKCRFSRCAKFCSLLVFQFLILDLGKLFSETEEPTKYKILYISKNDTF